LQSYQEISGRENLLRRQEDYLVANLLDYFRKVEHEENWFQASKMAKSFLKRSLNVESERLDKRLIFLASQLKNNLSPKSIRLFAHECIMSAAKIIGNPQNGQGPAGKKDINLHKKAMKDIKNFLQEGHKEQAALARAANGLMKERKKEEAQEKQRARISNHPLKETLELLNSAHKPLPREDIRNHLLHLKTQTNMQNKSQGMLLQVLKKAEAFSVSRIHKLLGDELFFLCRPLGFVDKNSQIVEVEVPTSAHLNALTYRKLEILRALKADPTFKTTHSIRLKVRCRLF